jgi:hypothetical protein
MQLDGIRCLCETAADACGGGVMEFGSTEGGWVYPILAPLTMRPFFVVALLAPCLAFFIHLAGKYIHTHEWTVVSAWIFGGFALQICIRSLAPFGLGNIVLSEDANSFYSVTLRYNPREFLASFHEIAATLPIHAKANMPGKVLLYFLLENFSASPETLGYLIILLSNLGGVLVYLITRKIFDNRVSAVYALILYLLLPAKLFFFPLLNAVTPFFILLPLLFLLLYLESRRTMYLLLEGASLYALVVFEPLPLVLGLVFLALLARGCYRNQINGADLARVVGYVFAAFVACHFLVMGLFSFDVWESFLFAVEDARAFNAEMGRPYGLWVIHNLKDFFFGAGLAASAVFLTYEGYLLGKLIWLLAEKESRWPRVRVFLAEPETLVTLSLLLVLLITDVIGVNRGETIRLWIFLAVFLQISVAHRCAMWARPWVFASLATLTLLQTAVTISTVGFVIP